MMMTMSQLVVDDAVMEETQPDEEALGSYE